MLRICAVPMQAGSAGHMMASEDGGFQEGCVVFA